MFPHMTEEANSIAEEFMMKGIPLPERLTSENMMAAKAVLEGRTPPPVSQETNLPRYEEATNQPPGFLEMQVFPP